MAEYQVIVYGWITADSLQEAEEMYCDNQWSVDYHLLEDENGRQFDANDIEELASVS